MNKKKFHLTIGFSSCLILLSSHHLAFSYADKHLSGLFECAKLLPEQITLPAKLDTGADYTSLHATDIELFDKKGQSWVRFNTADPNSNTAMRQLEKPLVRYARIKRSDIDDENESPPTSPRRPVVKMTVELANQTLSIEVNLADRSSFKYPMLIGKTALTRFAIIVDPSQTYLFTPSCESAS